MKSAIRQEIEKKERILSNTKLVSKLPDRGERIRSSLQVLREKLKDESQTELDVPISTLSIQDRPMDVEAQPTEEKAPAVRASEAAPCDMEFVEATQPKTAGKTQEELAYERDLLVHGRRGLKYLNRAPHQLQVLSDEESKAQYEIMLQEQLDHEDFQDMDEQELIEQASALF